MAMGVEKQTAEKLAKNAFCCECYCEDCPFIPRHEGGSEIDKEWLKFASTYPQASYEEYLAATREKR